MNAWQHAMEFREALKALRWPQGAQELVFGKQVYVVAEEVREDNLPEGFPFCMIFPGNGRTDRENPLLETRPFTFMLGQMQEGDSQGEFAVIGGPRAGSEIGTSQGRGIEEIASVVKPAVGRLYGADGHPIYVALSGAPRNVPLGQGLHIVAQNLVSDILCTASPEWIGPYNVQRSGNTVSWEHTPARAGLVEYVVVSGPAGDPPADPGSGTPIGTKPPNETSLTDPAVGAAGSVAVFAGYSLVDGSSSQVYSATQRGTWR